MSATPPSIAIAAPVLGGPEVVRVVLSSSSSSAERRRTRPTNKEPSERAFEQHLARRRPYFDDVRHLPARPRCRERNLYTLCWGKRAAGESSALPRRHLASPPFTLHEHGRGRLGQLLRQPRLRVADVRVRRRLRGLRPAHAALAPAATGLQTTAPHPVNTPGTPCPLHQHCHSHRNAS